MSYEVILPSYHMVVLMVKELSDDENKILKLGFNFSKIAHTQ